MSLPNPIPDNPLKWDGWKNYNSPNLYERLCLDFREIPDARQIEEHCRLLLVWWQKKLPLKNQPSNPMAQLLRAGMDEAPRNLAEARAFLLDANKRVEHDAWVGSQLKSGAYDELGKYLGFALTRGGLSSQDEANLLQYAGQVGLSQEEALQFIDTQLAERGVERIPDPVPEPAPETALPPAAGTSGDPFGEFRRLLRLTKLDDGEMTDDQRDALCNIGEGLGLTGGQAEDLIDEFIDEKMGFAPMQGSTVPPPPTKPFQPAAAPPTPPAQPAARPPLRSTAPAVAAAARPAVAAPQVQKGPAVTFSSLPPHEEVVKYPNFRNFAGVEMRLVTSGRFELGSNAPEAAPNEKPVSKVAINCFYLSRFPITNAQYEIFDPEHRVKRPQWADNNHPVVLVTSLEAMKFCLWLSERDKRTYRLPTEAEWEYAARGRDGRAYPWGMSLRSGTVANFADKSSAFAWKDPDIDDGYPQSSPVGAYPAGVGPFGHEDLAGNVWEWCRDFYAPYPETSGRERVNPIGPGQGLQRVLRGGSWKSRSTNVRCSSRAFNAPGFASNDVGFRVVCECK